MSFALLEDRSESSPDTSRSRRLIEDLSGLTSSSLSFSMLDNSSTFFEISYFKMSFVDLGLRLGKDF